MAPKREPEPEPEPDWTLRILRQFIREDTAAWEEFVRELADTDPKQERTETMDTTDKVGTGPIGYVTEAPGEGVWCPNCNAVKQLRLVRMRADGVLNTHDATDALCEECSFVIATFHHPPDFPR